MGKITTILKHGELLRRNLNIIPRIAQDYYNLLIKKENVLRKVDIAIIAGCNAKCPFCFATTLEDPTKEQLTLEEVKKCIDQSILLGAFTFEFLGGEPLLCHHLCDAIRYAKKAKTIVGVTTNGILLTENKINELSQAGLDVVQLSLGSMDHNEHDESRGVKGCYDKIMRALDFLKSSKLEVMLSTVVTNENLKNKKNPGCH